MRDTNARIDNAAWRHVKTNSGKQNKCAWLITVTPHCRRRMGTRTMSLLRATDKKRMSCRISLLVCRYTSHAVFHELSIATFLNIFIRRRTGAACSEAKASVSAGRLSVFGVAAASVDFCPFVSAFLCLPFSAH